MPNRYVPLTILRKIWGMPCVICGTNYRVHADHIVPVSLGGTGVESNIQPLCALCNAKKRNRLTNDQLKEWYLANKEKHHERIESRRRLFPEYT